jgi:hypothetical protein
MVKGRKPLPEGEKKILINLFVRKNTIRANGGIDACIKKCVAMLENIHKK